MEVSYGFSLLSNDFSIFIAASDKCQSISFHCFKFKFIIKVNTQQYLGEVLPL